MTDLDRLLEERFCESPDMLERFAILLLLGQRQAAAARGGQLLARVEVPAEIRHGDALVVEYRINT